MDSDRELFIQQLVAALQENTALSGGVSSLPPPLPLSADAADGSSSPDSSSESEKSPQEYTGLFLSAPLSIPSCDSERLALDAYMQLQFDFPQVQEVSIEALAELYRRVSVEKWPRAAEIPLTATLLDSVAYLNDQGPSSGPSGVHRPSRSSEGSGLLAASIFLMVFRSCLEMPEDPQVLTLLSSLGVKQQDPVQKKVDDVSTIEKQEEDEYVEKFAAQEDPDDLSEVYEGSLPEPREHRLPMWNQPTARSASRYEKLLYLSSQTYSSSFETVSMEKWEQWRLEDELVAIMKMLVENVNTQEDTRKELYGPKGEWSRYLYVLRDRILRFPGSSRTALWRLKELIDFLSRREEMTTLVKSSRPIRPQHLVYRVLAELAISREFHQGGAYQAQQGLALAIQELLPLITKEIDQIVSVAILGVETDDDGDDELAVVFLQLLHFMLFASSNARTTTEKLHESGMLRTLLMLLPTSEEESLAQYLGKRWFPALLRLLGECALWHAGFAAYISRVPKFVKLLPSLREQLVAEELLLALAFHQHQVQIRSPAGSNEANRDVWKVFVSDSVFPQQCESFLEAMKKLQDAVFVLDCLEKVLPVVRTAMQKELQRSLQQIYSGFAKAFEYPSFEAAEAARQQQQFQQQAEGVEAVDEKKKEKKEEERGQAEALQFTALRNKLRQSVKTLLTALSSDSAGGRASSKLD